MMAPAAGQVPSDAGQDMYTVLQSVNVPDPAPEAAAPTAPAAYTRPAAGTPSVGGRAQMPLPKGAVPHVGPLAGGAASPSTKRGPMVLSKDVAADELCAQGYRHAGWLTKRGDVVKNCGSRLRFHRRGPRNPGPLLCHPCRRGTRNASVTVQCPLRPRATPRGLSSAPFVHAQAAPLLF